MRLLLNSILTSLFIIMGSTMSGVMIVGCGENIGTIEYNALIQDNGIDDTIVSPPESGQNELPLIDNACLDGQYSEILPNIGVNLDSEVSTYNKETYKEDIKDLLKLRYPAGLAIVEESIRRSQALYGEEALDCLDFYLLSYNDNVFDVLKRLESAIQGCHFYLNIYSEDKTSTEFMLNAEQTFIVQGLTSTFENENSLLPAISVIYNDEFQQDFPSCSNTDNDSDNNDNIANNACDFNVETYLQVPEVSYLELDYANQGLHLLLEQAFSYNHALATAYAFHNFIAIDVYPQNNVLNFLWYIQRYIYNLRIENHEQYQQLLAKEDFRVLILTLWGRAFLYLDTIENTAGFTPVNEKLYNAVTNPKLVQEIDYIRKAHGC